MIFSRGSFLGTFVLRCLLFLTLTATARAGTNDFRLESVGARYGLSMFQTGNTLYEGEVFVDFNLPWRWNLGKDWSLQTKLNLSAGVIGGGGENAAEGTVGPALQLFPPNFPVSVEAGSSPTMMSKDIFGNIDMGTLFQFTTYIGFNLDITKHIRLGYRFQHISNAGLSQHNPGINMNMIALSYVF